MLVLLTGSAGFVGRHFTRRLEHDGHQIVSCDIADGPGQDVRRLADYRWPDAQHFDLVIHCAAIVGGRRSIDGTPLDVAGNLAIDHALYTWALQARPDRILYLSSSAAYPVCYQNVHIARYRLTEHDIDLTDPRLPDQTYGWAKLTGELLAQEVIAEDIPVHIVRPFSGYSETQSLDYPFPSFAARARAHADPFDVWGDGTQTRDFIHIDDIIEGALAVIDQDVRTPVNLGTGRPTTFDDLAGMFMAAAGYQGEIRHLETEPSGVHYRVADTTLLESVYQPTVTLEEGITRAVKAGL